MKYRLFLVVFFVSLLFSVSVFAKDMTVKIPFSFTAGTEVLPPGTYKVAWSPTQPDAIVLTDTAGTKNRSVPVLTTLSNRQRPEDPPCVAFDDVAGKQILSEVWFPGEDGLLLAVTHEKHTHHIIKP